MSDKWVIEFLDSEGQKFFEIYDSLQDAMTDIDEGDHLYKVPAESFQFQGTMTRQLIK